MGSQDDRTMPPGSDRQWWLTESSERCFLCESAVHPEMLAYCVACDRGLCLICLGDNHRNQEVLCPDCRAELAHSEREKA